MFNLLDDVSIEEAVFKTRRMEKELKHFRPTTPFHTPRTCDNKQACVWHRPRSKR